MGPFSEYLPDWLPQDPQKNSAARAGLLNFGAALMNGRGNLGNILGNGLLSGAQGYSGDLQQQATAAEAKQKQALQAAQTTQIGLENKIKQGEIDEPAYLQSIAAKVAGIGAPKIPMPAAIKAPTAAQGLVGGSPAMPQQAQPVRATPYSHEEAQAAIDSGIPVDDINGLNAFMANARSGSGAPPSQNIPAAPMPVASLPRVGPQKPIGPDSPDVQYQKLMDMGNAYADAGRPKVATAYFERAEKLKPKLKEQKALTVDGKRIMANVYEDGRTQTVDGYSPDAEKLSFQNTGGATVALDPFTGKPVNTIRNTQSPDSAASVAESRRAHNMEDARAKASTQQGRIPTGYMANKDGTLSFIKGGPADPEVVGVGKMSEDQAKATGWLVQAENAFGNMKSAIAKNPSAAKPGINDMIGSIPSFGVGESIANKMRGPERQMFMHGASSLSEALLRAATGAGMNENEAKQKVQELTPVAGEAPETTAQKMASIPLYIESLKVRAGPGAAKAAKVLGTKPAPEAKLPQGWTVEVH